ncbi:MAG: hypothetical protein JW854_12105 [Actinobacteria bacterium]|nr:hypothetical protein [Actinomycetota bacterium]
MLSEIGVSNVLCTKLYPPRLPEIVLRERLLEDLDGARSLKLTSIVAGAGYGKSTLAEAFLERAGCPFVWYSLEESDGDLAVFLTYIIAGLRSIHDAFGANTLEHMQSMANVAEQSKAVLSTLLAELDALIEGELFIVLDDFQEINERNSIIEALAFLLDHMLPNIHFLILSRAALNLDLSHLRARRELLEIDEDDLAFSSAETASLFGEIFRMTLNEEDLAALSEYTEGWIAGLVLFYLALKGKQGDRISAAIKELGVLPSAVADFLSKAIYESQAERVRGFLTHTSLLSRMNPQFCNDLLGIEDSQEILAHLTDERLFTIPLDDRGEWYRYHPCLRDFLRKALQDTRSPTEIQDLHLKAAALWDGQADAVQMLSHYMEASCYEQAADLLERIDSEMMKANRVSFLYREILRLPEDVLWDHPRLLLRIGQTAAILGDYNRGIEAQRFATEAFEKVGDDYGQALALLYLAGYYAVTGNPGQALDMTLRAREAIPGGSPYFYYEAAGQSLIQVGMGRADRARELLEWVLAHVEEIEAGRLKASTLTWSGGAAFMQGKLNKACELFRTADKLPEGAGLTMTQPFLYALLSRTHAFLDRPEQAREAAEKGLALGERLGLAPMVFFNRAARAVVHAYLGEIDAAREDAAAASSLADKHADSGESMYTQWFLADAYGLIGDAEMAMKYYRRVEAAAKDSMDFKNIAALGVIAQSVHATGIARALHEVRSILDVVKEGSRGMALSLAYSLLLTLQNAAGELAEGRRTLQAYIEDFGEDIILRYMTMDTEYPLSPFTELFSSGQHTQFMARVFTLAGTKSSPYLKKLAVSEIPGVAEAARELEKTIARQAVDPLTVRMLGPFRISRGDTTLSAGDFRSKKSLTILKYLAANQERGFIPREVIMELLWPEVPPASSSKSLNAALSALRKTLEPTSLRGESSYLKAEGELLRLELGPGGWTDTGLFKQKLASAAKAKETGQFDLYFRTLEDAASLYEGEFLAEDLYEDWCWQERETLRDYYVGTLADMATEHLRRGEPEKALSRLEAAVSKDPGREELYRKQMTICSQMGNRAGIEEAFRRCSAYLMKNYDVSPASDTVGLYEKLRSQ